MLVVYFWEVINSRHAQCDAKCDSIKGANSVDAIYGFGGTSVVFMALEGHGIITLVVIMGRERLIRLARYSGRSE